MQSRVLMCTGLRREGRPGTTGLVGNVVCGGGLSDTGFACSQAVYVPAIGGLFTRDSS